MKLIRQEVVILGGNTKLKIYGKLNCKSGKRMKKENRVFFESKNEAIQQGFRPCGHCLYSDYKNWKNGLI
ncbi:MAG: metal-binding protein [Segetibacter sp.]|nr:metal-binding protein [Segetibacter sp.]